MMCEATPPTKHVSQKVTEELARSAIPLDSSFGDDSNPTPTGRVRARVIDKTYMRTPKHLISISTDLHTNQLACSHCTLTSPVHSYLYTCFVTPEPYKRKHWRTWFFKRASRS